MGGDGGVVATNRRYMRGAGSADTTGDSTTGMAASAADVKANQERDALTLLTTCALTKAKLQPTDCIVACRYGRLYLKEAAVQALLRRKTGEATSEEQQALAHIKKLSDLYAVRGHFSKGDSLVWTCPITSKTLTGRVPPAILLVPGNPENPNVVSEFAHRQLSEQDMEAEYGPMERTIRLAPNKEQLAEVKAELEEERSTKEKKKKKNQEGTCGKRKKPEEDLSLDRTFTKEIRSRVDAALQSNQVLSSLFVDKEAKSSSSNKDLKDDLFAR